MVDPIADPLHAARPDAVDEIAFLSEGQVVVTGTHHDLMRDRPDYRAVVTRESSAPERAGAIR